MKKIVARTLQVFFVTLATLVVLLAVTMSIARLFLPHLTRYQAQIQQWASDALHQPVQIKEMTAVWRGIEPQFKMQHVAILDKSGRYPLLKVDELSVGIDVFDSLMHWRIEPGRIGISGATVVIRQDAQGKITFNGLAAPQTNSTADVNSQTVLQWLLSQNNIYLRNIAVTWYGKNGQVIPVKQLSLNLLQHFSSHRLVATAIIEQKTNPTKVSIQVDMDDDLLTNPKSAAKLQLMAFQVPLAFWLQPYIPTWQFTQGNAEVRVNATWAGLQLQTTKIQLQGEDIAFKPARLQKPLLLNQLQGNFIWQRRSDGWNIQALTQQLVIDGKNWPQVKLQYQRQGNAQQQITQTVQLNQVDLQLAKNILIENNFLTAAQQQYGQQFNPTGILQNVVASESEDNNHKVLTWSLQSEFSHLGWSRVNKIPGARQLNGQIIVSPSQGKLILHTQKSLWDFGNLFETMLPIDRVDTTINWQKNAKGWQIQTNKFQVANPVAEVSGSFDLQLPADHSSPVMHMLAHFNLTQPVPALRYLPVGVLAKNLVHWLREALVSSQAMSGNLVLTGPLKAFPFVKQEGQFLVTSRLHDLTLRYNSAWPQLTELNGDIAFVNNGMHLSADSGKIFQAKIQNTTADIADFHTANLEVKGNAVGNLYDGWQVLQQSPLYQTIGQRLKNFNMQGNMNLNLQLHIPLKAGASTVKGDVNLQNAAIQIPQWWHLEAQKITGDLQFTEDSLNGKLQAQLLQQPTTIVISTIHPDPKTTLTQFDLGQGQISVAQLQQRFDLPTLENIQGTLHYQALLQFGDMPVPVNRLTINSDLQGVQINLPAPLGKKAEDKIASQLQLQFGQTNTKVLINYDKRASAALNFVDDEKGQANLKSAELSFGDKLASLPTQAGIVIDGDLPVINWSDWQPIFKNWQNKVSKTNAIVLQKIDITFAQLNLPSYQFANLRLQMQPLPDAWQVQANNVDIDGQLTIPKQFPRGTVIGNFAHLYLPNSDADNKTTLSPKQVPAMQMRIQDLHYGNRYLGQVNFQLSSTAIGKNIDRLHLSAPGFDLNATGSWNQNGATQTTNLQGKLTTKDLGAVLKNWAVTKNLEAGKGDANFNLQWNDAPYQIAMKSLSGNLQLAFYDGRIVNLSKSTESELGLGRVLNLLSLDTLQRRLRLDFSDLTDSGFSFDAMKGDFTLKQGDAITRNAYLDGPVAKMALNGRIGLGAQDYDLKLSITPYITSSIPVVIATVANPIAGAVAWIASKIVSPVVGHFTTYAYQVTGSWDNPQMVKIGSSNVKANNNPTQKSTQNPTK